MTDADYLRVAYQAAADSPDPSTQCGAVLVSRGGKVLAYACNDFPAALAPEPPWTERPLKYAVIEHAERAAIYTAARRGVSTDGATLYAPWAACAECARAITCAGIRRLVTHKAALARTPERWRESIATGDMLLRAAGVEQFNWDGVFWDMAPIRFAGEVFLP